MQECRQLRPLKVLRVALIDVIFSTYLSRHKHHKGEVNRVSLNQDLNFKLGISTDLTKFRALDKESVNKVERLQECRQLRPLKVLRVALIYVILSTYLSQHKHHKDEVNRVSLHQNLNFKLGI